MNNTKVYVADTSDFDNKQLFAAYYLVMPLTRREKTDRCRFNKDKKLSLGVGSLLFYALSDCGFIKPGDDINAVHQEFAVAEDDNKKLYFVNHPEIKFNLSHSGSAVMCILSEGDVGCDVEEMRDRYADIAGRFFFNKEKQLIDESPDGRDIFFRLWTLKESFMKVTGLGFRLPLDAFAIEPVGTGARLHMTPECRKLLGSKADMTYRFYQFDYRPGYRLSCCVTNDSAVEFNTVSFKEFYNDYFSQPVTQA